MRGWREEGVQVLDKPFVRAYRTSRGNNTMSAWQI
jgi:hypothetical protein